jgi:hypothetical protein
MTELLQGTPLDEEQREYVGAIRESGKLLLTVCHMHGFSCRHFDGACSLACYDLLLRLLWKAHALTTMTCLVGLIGLHPYGVFVVTSQAAAAHTLCLLLETVAGALAMPITAARRVLRMRS